MKICGTALLLATFVLPPLLGGCAKAPSLPPAPPAATTAPLASPTPSATSAPTPTPYPYVHEDGATIASRFNPPPDYERKPAHAYGEFIRGLPLLPHGQPVLLYTGEESPIQNWHAAVLDVDVGTRDLQQCADAALRIRAEYLFSVGEYDKINYHLTNGDLFPYTKYREGYRLRVSGNKTSLEKTASPDTSYGAFRKYLDVLFNYASTRSLAPESETIPLDELAIGDIFIFAGSPGHCVIVVDMAENPAGDKAILLAQSSMPAQQIHILQQPGSSSPWLPLHDIELPVQIMYWDFGAEHIKRMP